MSRRTKRLTVLASLSLLMVGLGCQEPRKAPGPEQRPEAAADRINALQNELNQSHSDLAACQERELALRNENDRLKEQLARGVPTAEAGWTSVPGGAMIAVEGTVLFDSGKAQLKGGASGILGRVADTILQKYKGYDVYIFGHTDSEPIRRSGWKDNYELSCQRALTVLRFLRSKGVGSDICACGWGEDRPVADNRAPATRKPNRRVEIYVMAKARQ